MAGPTDATAAYTVGWLVAVVSLYGAHELDGHWLGWVAAFVGYGAGLAWVRRVRPHPSRE